MTGESALFWVLAPLAVAASIGMLFMKKAVHSAILLAWVMITLAIFYIALEAPFLGIVQIVVYTGAVMMLFLFILMLVGVDSSDSLVEKIKGLAFQIEREANTIAKQTRRGKGNIMLCSSDVASALAMAGILDYQSALQGQVNLTVDDTGNTFAGTLFGRIKVYIDPYFPAGSTNEFAVVGYKGSNAYDAGLFYCPYVPLQQVRAINPNTFQPKIGFKTRYGMVSNPFSGGLTQGSGALTANANKYYRRVQVANLM